MQRRHGKYHVNLFATSAGLNSDTPDRPWVRSRRFDLARFSHLLEWTLRPAERRLLDRTSHSASAGFGRQRVVDPDGRELTRELFVLQHVGHPAPVVVSAEMVQPRLVVHALR